MHSKQGEARTVVLANSGLKQNVDLFTRQPMSAWHSMPRWTDMNPEPNLVHTFYCLKPKSKSSLALWSPFFGRVGGSQGRLPQ